MKRAAIYTRLSTADQHVETLLYDLRQFAQQRGYEVICEYRDVGTSGSKARRPGLDAMLADARRMARRGLEGFRLGRQPLDINHEALVPTVLPNEPDQSGQEVWRQPSVGRAVRSRGTRL